MRSAGYSGILFAVERTPNITGLFAEEAESWAKVLKRIRDTDGDVLVVFSPQRTDLTGNEELKSQVLNELKPLGDRLRIATRDAKLATAARLRGLRVIE